MITSFTEPFSFALPTASTLSVVPLSRRTVAVYAVSTNGAAFPKRLAEISQPGKLFQTLAYLNAPEPALFKGDLLKPGFRWACCEELLRAYGDSLSLDADRCDLARQFLGFANVADEWLPSRKGHDE